MRNRVICAAAFAVIAVLPSVLRAGPVYGTVVDDQGRPIVNAAVTVITQGGRTNNAAAPTDAQGAYRVVVPEQGPGTLVVKDSAGDSASIRIYVFRDPLRWDLIRIGVAGEYTLKRRRSHERP